MIALKHAFPHNNGTTEYVLQLWNPLANNIVLGFNNIQQLYAHDTK